jgi:hypothetical protein
VFGMLNNIDWIELDKTRQIIFCCLVFGVLWIGLDNLLYFCVCLTLDETQPTQVLELSKLKKIEK